MNTVCQPHNEDRCKDPTCADARRKREARLRREAAEAPRPVRRRPVVVIEPAASRPAPPMPVFNPGQTAANR